MIRSVSLLAPLVVAAALAPAQPCARTGEWQVATKAELAAVLPARAQVVRERIETESTSNSGIVDRHGHLVAATVLITAGYEAHGRYSYLLVTQTTLKLDGRLALSPGSYLIGWDRGPDGLEVHLYRAESGDAVGTVTARPSPGHVTVVSVHVWSPQERGSLQIGRFFLPYQLC